MKKWLLHTAGQVLGSLRQATGRNREKKPDSRPPQERTGRSFSSGFHFEPLEPRLLLSATADGVAAGAAIQSSQMNTEAAVEAEQFDFHDAARSLTPDILQSAEAFDSADPDNAESPNEQPKKSTDPAGSNSETPDSDSSDPKPAALLSENPPDEIAPLETESVFDEAGSQEADFIVDRSELVIVDGGITDYRPLVEDLLDRREGGFQYEVAVLDPERDGVSQISELLSEHQDLDAVHIVSHGTDSAVKLGSVWVYGETFEAYGEDIAGWKSSLADGADLLFYGCDLAAGEDGRALLGSFAAFTGADVAASVDDTGHADFNGDWELEYEWGGIETQVAFSNDVQQRWSNLMAVITVDTTADVDDGDTSSIANLIATPGTDGFISLREAIIAANNTAGADEIILPAGIYTLSIPSTGEDASADGDLDISTELTITGGGAASTIIDGGALERVLDITSSGNAAITGVTLQNGGNVLQGGGVRTVGGGGGSQLSMTEVIVTSNTANQGGGIYAGGVVTLTDVEISGNDAGTGVGGGIYNSEQVTLNRVTISGNTAADGAGIYVNGAAVQSLTNVTISTNTATGDGGGIYTNKSMDLTNVTITGNSAASGGGIHATPGQGDANLKNTLFYNNTGGNANKAMTSLGYNVEDGNTAFTATTGDQQNVADPKIGPLQDNGGFTQTHALLTGSAAIDSGTGTGAPGVDQRGYTRDATPDVGAYEFNASVPASGFWITTQGDGASPSGVKGLDSWVDGDVLQFADPDLVLEPGGSDGSLSVVFNIDQFINSGPNTEGEVDAIHYVTQNLTVGNTTTFDLHAGDLILSTALGEPLTSTNSLTVDDSDLFVFRPDTPGDYSAGTFHMLLDESADPTGWLDVVGITLVEKDTAVGDTTVQAGSFLIVEGAAASAKEIHLYTPDQVGATTSGTISVLIDGVEAGLGDAFDGIELIEETSTVGGTTLSAGSILITQDGNSDISYLDVTATEIGGTNVSAATATLLLDGTAVGLDTADENTFSLALIPGSGATPANQAPTLTIFASTVDTTAEDTDVEITFADLAAQGDEADTDGTVDAFVVKAVTSGTVLIGADAGSAAAWAAGTNDTIDATNNAYWTPATDANGTLNAFTVVAEDNDGAESAAPVQVQVAALAVNDAPVITSDGGGDTAAISAAENQTAVTTVAATDVDSDTPTFAISGGADQAKFSINASTGVLTFAVAPDFETPTDADTDNTYEVQVTASDGNGGTDTQAISVTVSNVNEAPVITSDGGGATAAVSAAENQTAVTTVTASDVDGDTPTFAISGGADAAAFNINATTGVLTFAAAPDFETPADSDTNNVYEVQVTTSDGNGGTDTQTISVSVTDANDAPVITSGGGGATAATSAAENQTAVTTVAATDADGDTPTFAISGGADQAKFSINATTGVLTFAVAPDFETPADADTDNIYEVQVTASDGNGGTDTQAISVTVTNVNEPPVITSDGGGATAAVSAAENQTAVTTVTASDIDGDTPTFAISGGADQANFSINATTGELTFAAAPDFETPADTDIDNVYEVQITTSDGNGGTDTQAISVTVTDANDAPVITSDGGGDTASVSAVENQTAVTTVTAADIDGDTPTFAISGGADQAKFSINTTTGVLTFAVAPDFETPADADTDNVYEVQVTASDGSGGTDTQAISVTVTGANDAPVIDDSGAAALTTINENEINNNGDLVADIIASPGGDPITDADAGAVEGIAVVTVDDANGTWQYSTDGGTSWTDFGTVSDSSAVVLADSADDRIRFVPDTNYNGAALISYRAWDRTDGNSSGTAGVDASATGGATAFSTVSETASVTITPVEIVLHLSTEDDVSGSGVAGLSAWSASEALAFGGPLVSFEPGTTTGTLESLFDLDDYANKAVSIDGMHVVSESITVGGGGNTVDLEKEDVLFAVSENSVTFTGNDSVSISADKKDVIRYRPSDGSFEIVLDDVIPSSIEGLSLVEANTSYADGTTLASGSFLLNSATQNRILYLEPAGAGAGINPGAPVLFFDGSDIGVGEASVYIGGIDLIEDDISPGGTTLSSGQLLLTLDGGDTDVGDNNITVTANDIFYVTLTKTTLGSGVTEGTATLFAEGADVNLDTADEQPDSLSFDAQFGIQSIDPTISLPGGVISYTEGDPATIIDAGATLVDPDSADFERGKLRVDFAAGGSADDRLAVRNQGTGAGQVGVVGSTVSYGGTDIGTLTGGSGTVPLVVTFNSDSSVTAVQAVMRNSTYENVSEAPSTVPRTVRFALTDGDGGESNVLIETINVTAVNDAPVVGAPGAALSATEQTALAIEGTGFTVSDADAAGGGMQATLSVGEGTLTVAVGDSGVTVAGGNGSGTVALTGTASQIDSLLTGAGTGTITYFNSSETPAASTTLTVTVNDQGNTGTDPGLTGDGSSEEGTNNVTINITAVNDDPVITSDGGGDTAAVSAAENQGAVTTVIATDADADTPTFAISGGADAALFSIDLNTGVLTFAAAPDFESPADADTDNVYEVQVTASDGNGGTDTQAISATVTNVNEAPVITSDGGGATAAIGAAENQTAVTTVTATDEDGDTPTFAISGGADAAAFNINATTGALTFTVAPDFETPVDADANNVYEVQVSASDGNGGTDTQAISVTVTDANDDPVITSDGGGATAAISAIENQTTVTTVTATDEDGDTPAFAISGGADAAAFNINATTGALTFAAAPDFEAPADADTDNVYEVQVTASDGSGGTDTQAISVTVTNANDAPVITSDGGGAAAAVSAAENQTAVTTVTATDEDGDTPTFAISGGADAGRFSIDAGTGVLTFNAAPDFESPADADTDNTYEVQVTAADGNGGTDTQAISITVTNVNEAPVITSDGGGATAAVSAAENQTAVTTVTATDVDGDTPTFAISSGADAGRFFIDANTGVLTFSAAPDYEAPADADADNVYEVQVTASDGNGGTDTQAISVTVTNVNEAPVITSDGGGAAAAVSAAENQTAVTTVTATDEDGDTPTFAISGGADAAAFNINATTGALTFTVAPDFETPADADADNVYEVQVTASDGNGGTDTQAISVTVTDANDDPVITSDGGGATAAISAIENQTTVTTVTATDEDGDTPAFAISGGADAAAFNINATTGALTFAAAPDFEAPADADTDNVYEVQVTASDGSGGTDTQAISVTVTNANDAPVITSDGGGAAAAVSAAENQTAVTTVTATDEDGDTPTFAISGGADAGRFSIDAGTGVLTFNAAPDFESPADADTDNTYEVQVTAADGNGGTDTQAISITVTNVNEAPVITSDGGGATAAVSAAENQTAVTTVTATDVDGDTPTFAISSGADAGRFFIDANTGVLTFSAAPDYEAPADADADNVYEVQVTASDGNGGTDTQAISVTVTNVNEAPVITSDGGGAAAAVSAAENQTAVTTVTATDVDGDTPTFAISGGADAGRFSIDAGTGVLTFNAAPDFESPADADTDNIYEVQVTASDGNGGTDTQAISVTVTNENEAPVITSDGGGATATVGAAENQTAVTTVTATDVDGDTPTFAITGGADAAHFSIDANTGVLTFAAAPDFETPADSNSDNVYEVQVTASDGNGGIDAQAISVTVTNVNEAPTNTVPGAQTTLVDTALVFSGATGNAISIGDVDAASVQVTLTATNGTLTLAGTAGLAFSPGSDGSADGVMTFTGSIADINTALDGMIFTPAAAYTGAAGVQILTNDQGNSGAGGALSDTDAVTVTVNAVNSPPAATNLNASETGSEGFSVNLTDIVVTDPDSSNVTVTLTLSNPAAGSLSTGTSGGATSAFAGGVWTASGAIADVNTLLADVVFTPAGGYSGNFTITVSVDDGAAPPVTGVKQVTLAPAPDPPAIPVDDNTTDPVEVPEPPPEPPEPEPEPVIEEETDSADDSLSESESNATVPPVAQPAAKNNSPQRGYGTSALREAEEKTTRNRQYESGADLDPGQIERAPSEAPPAWYVPTPQLPLSDPNLQRNAFELLTARAFEFLENSLNDVKKETTGELQFDKAVLSSAIAVTTGLSMGYVAWLLRSGVLLSSLLSSMPAWRFLDPLPILAGKRDDAGEEDEETLESIIKKGSKAADRKNRAKAPASSPLTS